MELVKFFEYAEPIVLTTKQLQQVRRIGLELHYRNRILRVKKDMDTHLAVMESHFNKFRSSFTRLNAIKYFFYKYCLSCLCELVLFDRESKIVSFPPVSDPDDVKFSFDLNYYLRVTNKKKTERTIFSVDFVFNRQNTLILFVLPVHEDSRTCIMKIYEDPLNIPPNDCRDYIRDLITNFEITFFTPLFYRVQKGLSISSPKSTQSVNS